MIPTLDRRGFMALLAAGGALSGAASAQEAPKKGGVLKVSAQSNPSSLDPTTGGAGSDHIMLYTMFDTLIAFEYDTLKPIPGLAEAWSFPDDLTMVLKLRPGILFHDGTPCDAEAVKANFDRNRFDERSNVKPDLSTVADVVVTGPLEVTLKLKQPDSALPLILSDRAGMMASPTAFKAQGRGHDRAPVGAGPWQFVSWLDNEKIVVRRFDKYWRPGRPYLDGIEFQIIPEVNTGLRSVIAGQNDFVYLLSPQQKQVIDRAKQLTPITGPTLYCVQFYINYGRAPLNDIRVRQALNYATNREEFNQATMNGLSEPAGIDLPSAHWAYDKAAATRYPYDPDKARALLAEAGFKDGIDIAGLGYTDQRHVQRQEVLIEQYRKAGIRLKFTNGTIPEMTNAFFVEKKGDIYLSAWTGRPDPSLTYQLMFGAGSFYNASRIEPVPELGPALLETRKFQDLGARKEAFAKLLKIVSDNALVVPLVFQFELDAAVKRMRGYQPTLLGKPKFENVWLEG